MPYRTPVSSTPKSLAARSGLALAALGRDEIVTIKVSADEIDACRATLADVLGAPLKAPMTPDAHDFDSVGGALPLPMVQCVVEARAD